MRRFLVVPELLATINSERKFCALLTVSSWLAGTVIKGLILLFINNAVLKYGPK